MGKAAPTEKGLLLRGIVVARWRRAMTLKSGETAEVVTYRISCDDEMWEVQQWRPSQYHAVGEAFEARVTPRLYKDRIQLTLREAPLDFS